MQEAKWDHKQAYNLISTGAIERIAGDKGDYAFFLKIIDKTLDIWILMLYICGTSRDR